MYALFFSVHALSNMLRCLNVYLRPSHVASPYTEVLLQLATQMLELLGEKITLHC